MQTHKQVTLSNKQDYRKIFLLTVKISYLIIIIFAFTLDPNSLMISWTEMHCHILPTLTGLKRLKSLPFAFENVIKLTHYV